MRRVRTSNWSGKSHRRVNQSNSGSFLSWNLVALILNPPFKKYLLKHLLYANHCATECESSTTETAPESLWSIWEPTILNTEYILWPGILSNFCSLSRLTLENITIIIKSTFQMRKVKPRGIKVTPQRSGRAGIRIQFCLNPECNPDSLLSQHSVGIFQNQKWRVTLKLVNYFTNVNYYVCCY